MRHATLIRGLLALALVAATTGCVQTSQKPTPPPAESHLVVTPNGIGELTIGLPVTTYALVRYSDHACATTGGWVPRYPQDELNSIGQEVDPFDVHTPAGSQSGQIQSEFVWSRKIHTAKGIHVGSTLEQVKAAYPSAASVNAQTTVLYVVNGTRGKLVIEIVRHDDAATAVWPQSFLDTVVWMDVVSRGAQARPINGNDDGGPCPGGA